MASEFDLDDEFALPTRVTRRGVKPALSKPKVVDEFALDEPSTIAPRTPRRGVRGSTQEQTQDLLKAPATSREFPSTFDIETGGVETPAAEGVDEEELPPKEVVNFSELVKPDNMATIKDYAEARFGNAGKQKEGESDEDYVKRWMTAMRQTEWNTTLNGVPELNWIYNAKKEDVLKAAKAHELYESVPDWYEKGGQPGIRPFAEGALSAFSDPSSLLGFGIGAFARYKAARTGINVALKDRIKAVTAGAAVEGAVGVAATAVDAQRELELDKSLVNDKLDQEIQNLNSALEFGEIEEDQYNLTLSDIEQARVENESRNIDPTRVALGAAFSAAIGGIEAGTAFRKPKISTKEDLERVISSRTKTPQDVETQKLIDAFDADMEDTLIKFDIFEGRQILDELSPQTALTQAEVSKDINTRAINVARYILLIDPAFSQVKQRVASKQQKVSDAVEGVFMSIDSIDEDILDAALNKAGLTLKEFGQATRTTVADAASIMQGYSTLAKVLKKAVKLDPEAERLVAKMYGRDNDGPAGVMGYIGNAVTRLERESKAFVVSSIATTVRNAYGTTGGITMDAATRILEGTVFAFGSAAKATAKGGVVSGVKELGTGLNVMVRDAFNTLTYLTNAGITAEVTDKLLANNPKLQHMLFNALQESGKDELSRPARFVNTFNVAQDVYFRRAIFTASVERQMRRVGLDMYQVMADGKNIPVDILKNAADDALKGTFSYMPKAKKGKGIEATAESLGGAFVRAIETNLPRVGIPGSLIATFPRFMTNAIAFQYRYSPVGGMSGVSELIMAANKFSKDPDQANRLYRSGVEKVARGSVGTALILLAYNERLKNQDTSWFNVPNDDGSTTDIRAVYPLGFYFAAGDVLAKFKLNRQSEIDVPEVLETFLGMKLPAGTQSSFINSLPEIVAAEEGKEADRFYKAIGRWLGDYFGRVLQPGQPIFAFLDQFTEESQIARDPNVLTSDNLLTEAAINRIQVKIPEWKEDLPEAVQYLRNEQETRVRAGEFLNLLTGVRVVPAVNKIEREFINLGLDPYTFYGASGDKTYDRTLITKSGPYIEKFVGKLIESDRYLNMTPAQRKLAVTKNMQYALSIGRSLAQADLTMSDRDRINKMTFYKLPQRDRKIINELYAENNDGRTLDEDKAYDQVYKYKALLGQFQ